MGDRNQTRRAKEQMMNPSREETWTTPVGRMSKKGGNRIVPACIFLRGRLRSGVIGTCSTDDRKDPGLRIRLKK